MSVFAQVLSSEYDLLLSWNFIVAKMKTFMCVYVGHLILLVIPVMPVILAEVGCTLQPQHLQTPPSLIDWTSTTSSSRWWSRPLLGQGKLEWCAHDALLYGSSLPGIHHAVPLCFSSLFLFVLFFHFQETKSDWICFSLCACCFSHGDHMTWLCINQLFSVHFCWFL